MKVNQKVRKYTMEKLGKLLIARKTQSLSSEIYKFYSEMHME